MAWHGTRYGNTTEDISRNGKTILSEEKMHTTDGRSPIRAGITSSAGISIRRWVRGEEGGLFYATDWDVLLQEYGHHDLNGKKKRKKKKNLDWNRLPRK